MPSTKTTTDPIPPGGLDSLGEEAWIEVIRKMDEVYSDLVQYEVALEEKNTALEETQRFVFSVLASMSDILVVCDRDGRIEVVNRAMVAFPEGRRRTSSARRCSTSLPTRRPAPARSGSLQRRVPRRAPQGGLGGPGGLRAAPARGGRGLGPGLPQLHAAPQPPGGAGRHGHHRAPGG